MERPLDRRAFIHKIQTQTTYESPIEEGMYLGFLIEGERVLLERVDSRRLERAPKVVARSISALFQ